MVRRHWTLAVLLVSALYGCEQNTKVPQEAKASLPVATDALVDMPEALDAGTTTPRAKKEPALPGWAAQQLTALHLDTLYQPANFTSPTFLEGDFNGDKAKDIAFLVTNKRTSEKGILIFHRQNPKAYYVLGAGTEIEGMTDLDWIKIFEKIPKGESVSRTLVDEETGDIIGPDSLNAVTLKSEGIYTHLLEECGGGIVYWDRNKYVWLHQE